MLFKSRILTVGLAVAAASLSLPLATPSLARPAVVGPTDEGQPIPFPRCRGRVLEATATRFECTFTNPLPKGWQKGDPLLLVLTGEGCEPLAYWNGGQTLGDYFKVNGTKYTGSYVCHHH